MNGRLACAAILTLIAGLPLAALAQTAPPWMNASLSPDARADLLQAQMTLDEELTLVRGYPGMDYPWTRDPLPKALRSDLPGSAGYVPGIPRLGIPAQRETDASLGVANGRHMRPGDQATALPSSLLTASTWNPTRISGGPGKCAVTNSPWAEARGIPRSPAKSNTGMILPCNWVTPIKWFSFRGISVKETPAAASHRKRASKPYLFPPNWNTR